MDRLGGILKYLNVRWTSFRTPSVVCPSPFPSTYHWCISRMEQQWCPSNSGVSRQKQQRKSWYSTVWRNPLATSIFVVIHSAHGYQLTPKAPWSPTRSWHRMAQWMPFQICLDAAVRFQRKMRVDTRAPRWRFVLGKMKCINEHTSCTVNLVWFWVWGGCKCWNEHQDWDQTE